MSTAAKNLTAGDWLRDLAALRATFLEQAETRIADALRLLEDLWLRPDDRPSLVALHVQLHKLTGSAGSYGYKDASVRARVVTLSLEEVLESTQAPSAAVLQSVGAALTAITARFALPPDES